MNTFNNLPIYDATFEKEGTGILCVSLVDFPAVESDFLKFKKEPVKQLYAVQDQAKRIVRGVLMRADFPIYRVDAHRGEYYIVFKKEQVRLMAEKYLASGDNNLMDTMHNNLFEYGVQMVQFFIKDIEKGINPEGFEDIEDGSLFAEYHITNDDVWNKVLDGTYRGFSIEVIPEVKRRKENKKMSKLSRMFKAIEKAMLDFSSITTDKGVIFYDNEDEIAEGVAVYTEDAEGNRIEIEDGEYKTDDGKSIIIEGGIVKTIADIEPVVEEEPQEEEPIEEPTPVEEPVVEEPKEDEGKPVEPVVEEPKEEEETPVEDEKDKRIAELEALVAELNERIAELEGENEKLSKVPLAESAHDKAKEQEQTPSLLERRLKRRY